MNKELCIKVGKWNNSILWCTVKETSNYKEYAIYNKHLHLFCSNEGNETPTS